jgi:HlyD family secretion protein
MEQKMSQDQNSSSNDKTDQSSSLVENDQNVTSQNHENADKHSSEIKSENSTQNQTTQQHAPSNKKKSILIIAAVIILSVLLALIAFGLWKSYQPKMVDIQGRVEADSLYVSTKVPSRIEEIYVTEGQKVEKNQPLVRLYSPEVDAKKQQAQASLQSALALQSTADRGSQQENIDSLYANWQSLKAQQNLAQTTFQRGENLYRQGVISRQRRDEMQAAALSSSQLTEAAYQQYARAKRGSTPEQKQTADAQVDIAKAAVNEVNALEAETKLFAPTAGTISKTYGKVSELVASGVPVVSIIQDQHPKVILNVREDQYAHVYQSKTLQGYIPALQQNATFKIENIDAEGEFATIKTTRQTGGYDIRSFKLHLVPVQPIKDLKVGMSVIFKIQESK